MEIRPATSQDAASIRDLTIAAFSASEFGHNGEADLIEALTGTVAEHLSLVATIENKIVGHILFTLVVLRADSEEQSGMGLAPMSVAPDQQRRGVGSTLVREGLERLFDGGCVFAAVLGHPAYYPRFGFEPAGSFGVAHGFEGIPQEVFFLSRNPHTVQPIPSGRLFFDSAFGEQHAS